MTILENYKFLDVYLSDLVTINCPLCGQHNPITIGKSSRGGVKIETVICATCSLIYLNPKPAPEKYSDFYATGDYRRFLNMVRGGKDSDNINDFLSDEKFNKRKEYGELISRVYFQNILSSNDLYFDFGCDTGGILAGVQAVCNCHIMGNEPSVPGANYIKEKLGIAILNSTMEEISENDKQRFNGKVKIASIIGTLEHVNNPIECLNIAYDMLMDGGYLYIESFDILRRMESYKESIDDVATIDHQYYFHHIVYEYMLKQLGFRVVKFDHTGKFGKMMCVLAQKISKDQIESSDEFPKTEVYELVEKVNMLNRISKEHKKKISVQILKTYGRMKALIKKMLKKRLALK